jgi:hypothetical protein
MALLEGQKAGFEHSNGRGAKRHYLPGQIWHITHR